jgi:peptidoglycan/xylan/chitin deacetylase (PgdA/CDA1 family)
MSLIDPVIRTALTLASRGRLSVLIYHRIPAEPDPLLPGEPCAAEFESRMRWVKSVFNVISLADGIEGIKNGRLPARALAITFDDGYANNATVAAPVLSRLGLHATFFVATGFLDGGCMFNDQVIESVRQFKGEFLDLESLALGTHSVATTDERRRAIESILRGIKYRPESERAVLADRLLESIGASCPLDLMMTSAQAAGLATAGFALGGHTVNHPILAQLDRETALHEIQEGRRYLEDISGSKLRHFAYPNGRPDSDYAAVSVQLVRDLGFAGAVSTSRGAAVVGSDPLQIPRFTPWGAEPGPFARQMMANLRFSSPQYVAG